MILSRLNAEAGMKIQLLSIKIDIKDIHKIRHNATLTTKFFIKICNGFIIFEEIKAFLNFSVLIFNQINIDR